MFSRSPIRVCACFVVIILRIDVVCAPGLHVFCVVNEMIGMICEMLLDVWCSSCRNIRRVSCRESLRREKLAWLVMERGRGGGRGGV